jgi:hypothetical protein
MWNIKAHSRNDGLTTLLHYNTYIEYDKSITFELSPTNGEYPPILVNFSIRKDPSKSNFLTEKSELVNRTCTLTYYNPGKGSSGLLEPFPILANDVYVFKVMFQTILLNDANFLQLSIEFFIENV